MTTVTLAWESHKQTFAERVLPTVERHARFVFRHLGNRADDFADAVADCLAHAWEGYVWAVEAGKQPQHFPAMIATFAARKTKVGRKVGKRQNAKDVFSAATAHRTGLDALDALAADVLEDALADNTETPPPDQAAFRLDFPAWLLTLSARDRDIARTLAAGHSAKDVSERFGLSPGRVTQIRQQLCDGWVVFTA